MGGGLDGRGLIEESWFIAAIRHKLDLHNWCCVKSKPREEMKSFIGLRTLVCIVS